MVMMSFVVYQYENETRMSNERLIAFSFCGTFAKLVDKIFAYGADKLGLSCDKEYAKKNVDAFGVFTLNSMMRLGSVSVVFQSNLPQPDGYIP